MVRFLLCMCVALALAGTTGCGPGITIPLPVPPTPAPAEAQLAPRLPPPPSEVARYGADGLCGHQDLGYFAAFYGEYNASDGAHYHGWQPPREDVFWVRC